MANPKVVVGKTLYVEHDIRDPSDHPVPRAGTTWASSDITKATVAILNEAGALITGVAVGTATITATNGSDSGAINIDIIPAPPALAAHRVNVYIPRDRNNIQG